MKLKCSLLAPISFNLEGNDPSQHRGPWARCAARWRATFDFQMTRRRRQRLRLDRTDRQTERAARRDADSPGSRCKLVVGRSGGFVRFKLILGATRAVQGDRLYNANYRETARYLAVYRDAQIPAPASTHKNPWLRLVIFKNGLVRVYGCRVWS